MKNPLPLFFVQIFQSQSPQERRGIELLRTVLIPMYSRLTNEQGRQSALVEHPGKARSLVLISWALQRAEAKTQRMDTTMMQPSQAMRNPPISLPAGGMLLKVEVTEASTAVKGCRSPWVASSATQDKESGNSLSKEEGDEEVSNAASRKGKMIVEVLNVKPIKASVSGKHEGRHFQAQGTATPMTPDSHSDTADPTRTGTASRITNTGRPCYSLRKSHICPCTPLHVRALRGEYLREVPTYIFSPLLNSPKTMGPHQASVAAERHTFPALGC